MPTIEACLDTFYAVLSGPAGQPRDWDAFRALFLPGASLAVRRADGVSVRTVDEYIAHVAGFLEARDFYEFSAGNEVRMYGDIAAVENRYEAFADPDRREALKRGRNLVSLAHDGSDWKIASMLWQDGA